MGAGNLTTLGAVRITSGGSLKSGITHIALFTADPGDAGSMTNEVVGALGYARQAIVWSSTGGVTESNTNQINFTAAGLWGNCSHWGLVTNGTRGSGQVLMHGALNQVRNMSTGMQIRLNPGQITITGLTT